MPPRRRDRLAAVTQALIPLLLVALAFLQGRAPAADRFAQSLILGRAACMGGEVAWVGAEPSVRAGAGPFAAFLDSYPR